MKNIKNNANKKMMGKDAELWMEILWDELLRKISQETSKEKVAKILEKLVSESEKKTILRRLGVLALVRAGKTYGEIGEILWLSPNTVSTIKKNVSDVHKNYKSYVSFYGGPRQYSDIIKTKTRKPFGDLDLWDIFMNPPRPQGIGLRSAAAENVPLRRPKK